MTRKLVATDDSRCSSCGTRDMDHSSITSQTQWGGLFKQHSLHTPPSACLSALRRYRAGRSSPSFTSAASSSTWNWACIPPNEKMNVWLHAGGLCFSKSKCFLYSFELSTLFLTSTMNLPLAQCQTQIPFLFYCKWWVCSVSWLYQHWTFKK